MTTVTAVDGPVLVTHRSPAREAPDSLVAQEGSQVRAMAGGLLALTRQMVHTDPGSCVSWRVAVFRNAPLPEVVAYLERERGVNITLAPELKGTRISANFEVRSTEQIVQQLATALDAEIERTGTDYVLRKR